MIYSIEHIVATLLTGIVLGFCSALLLSKQKLSVEMNVALLLIVVWLCIHIYGFFFSREVDWIFNLVGFGAVGTFVGINIREVTGFNQVVSMLKRK